METISPIKMAQVENPIPHNFITRDYQDSFYNCIADGYKRGVKIAHRRWGKDKTAWNLMIKESQKRVGNYLYIFPEFKQARLTVWEGKDRLGYPFLDHIPEEIIKGNLNNVEMKAKFKNGSMIYMGGADSNPDSYRGPNPVGIVFSEYSYQNPHAWDVMRPILMENKGWALFIYTPLGQNHGFELYEMAKNNDKWYCDLETIENTGVFTKEDVEEEIKQGMSKDKAQQEFYCSFVASIIGAYYSKEMQSANEQDRICGVPVVAGVPVSTYWDLGIDDSMTIWFNQEIGREIHLVNCYGNSGEGLTHYVNYLKDWRERHNVTFKKHWLPHDARNRELQTGKSSIDFLKELGVDCDTVDRPAKKEHGIEAVRQILSICWFDKKECDIGIQGLTQYRKKWDEVNRVFSNTPLHDWASHWNDGFQTMALYYQSIRPVRAKQPTIYEPTFSGGSAGGTWAGK